VARRTEAIKRDGICKIHLAKTPQHKEDRVMTVRIGLAISLFASFLFLGAASHQQNTSKLRLLVGPDQICAKPTQCFTSRPGTGSSKAVVTTCEDTENKGGCSSFAVACIYGSGTYEGNQNKGKCTT
jgi:hypothetical protein